MLVLCTVLYTDEDIVLHRMVLNPLGVNRGSRKADVSRHVKWSDDRLGRCFSKSNGGWVQSAVGRLTREMHRVSCRSLHACVPMEESWNGAMVASKRGMRSWSRLVCLVRVRWPPHGELLWATVYYPTVAWGSCRPSWKLD